MPVGVRCIRAPAVQHGTKVDEIKPGLPFTLEPYNRRASPANFWSDWRRISSVLLYLHLLSDLL